MVILRALIWAYILAIILVIIGSWIPMDPDSPFHKGWTFCRRVTDPVLEPVRRLVPPVGGALDLSPTIVLLVLFVLLSFL